MTLVKEAVIGECVKCFKGKVWLARNGYCSYKVCERCLRVVDGNQKLNIAVKLIDKDTHSN